MTGYRTYVAAVIAALLAIDSVLGVLPPGTHQAVLDLCAALGLYGLRAAIAREAQGDTAPVTPPPPLQMRELPTLPPTPTERNQP